MVKGGELHQLSSTFSEEEEAHTSHSQRKPSLLLIALCFEKSYSLQCSTCLLLQNHHRLVLTTTLPIIHITIDQQLE